MRFTPHRQRPLVAIAGALAVLTTLTACGGGGSAAGTTGPTTTTAITTTGATTTVPPAISSTADGSAVDSASPGTTAARGSGSAESGNTTGGSVTLVTHDSFNMDKSVIADFESSSGIQLKILAQGDAGAMVNKLVLTKDKPLGDVVFGIDNSFASRALDAGVLQSYVPTAAANGADKYAIDPQNRLTAVDYGDVCINVDHRWFADKKRAEPRTYEDLTKPEYKNLLVVPSPATSSPGLAFLLGTVAHFGSDGDPAGWLQYWTALKNNGVKVTAGWEDAYTVDFSGSSGKGARPLVLSYASSPPIEMKAGETEAPTGALLNTCFRQVEYTGVLAGAANPDGAKKVVDFLLSKKFQDAMPGQMYVYPVSTTAKLPASWKQFAPAATKPEAMDPAEITDNREKWIGAWSDLMEN